MNVITHSLPNLIKKRGGNMYHSNDSFYIFTIKPILSLVGLILLYLIIFHSSSFQSHFPKNLKIGLKKRANGIIFGKIFPGIVAYSPTKAEGSIGVFSATGTGKTSSIAIPTLRQWNGTSFTIDISGDICKNCPNIKNKLIFSPEDQSSNPYNVFGPIDDIKNKFDQNEALVQLAYLLMPETPNINDNARFFLVNGRKILIAALICFYHANYDFIEICELIVQSDWKSLFQRIDQSNNSDAISYINSFVGASEQNTAGCKQSCDEAITLFATNHKLKNTVRRPLASEISIEPKKIEDHNIFVIIEDEKIDMFTPLLSIITSQQMQYISARHVTNDSSTILLLLDEFASLRIDATTILNALRKYRKRKARTLIMTQNLADLEILYGHNVTRAIMSNLRFNVLLGGLGEIESQKYFSDLIGYKKQSNSLFNSGNNQTNYEPVQKLIFEPSELDQLGQNRALLIYPNGYKLLWKNYYFK